MTQQFFQQQLALQQALQQQHLLEMRQVPIKAAAVESSWSKFASPLISQDMLILGVVCFFVYLVVSLVPIEIIAEKLSLPIFTTSHGDLVLRAVMSAVSVVVLKSFVL